MGVVNKQLVDSIGVKMLNVADDVFRGMKGKTAKKVLNEKIAEYGISDPSIKKAIQSEFNKRDRGLAYKAGNFMGEGIRESIKDYNTVKAAYNPKDPKSVAPSVFNSLKKGHSKQIVNGAGQTVDGLDMKRIAGTAAGISAVGRIATGGGLYKDRYGNTNIPVVPFI